MEATSKRTCTYFVFLFCNPVIHLTKSLAMEWGDRGLETHIVEGARVVW